MSAYKLLKSGVLRLADNANIPPTTDNMDWVRYLEWIAEGNTPDPADPEPVIVKTPTLEDVISVLTDEQKLKLGVHG